ncbi:unnamed protein product [Rotaria sordida]|uniref:Palmitoyltransferase n=1 Tax=Rotaria sordida TaxID=392033 RepID=A0A814THY8_9BILA|nr:unnamed protein product [Rotaria sordida]CAF1412008.1 unnamed protein product [Rotaria sordida]
MLFRKDPCGIVCILLTYAMLLHCLYVILFVLIIPLFNESLYGTLNALIICSLIFLSILSHVRAAYSDPGFIPLPKKGLDFSDVTTNVDTNSSLKSNEIGWTICNRCDTYRPARSHHCRICKRCVRRLDHHCPWINNCVGEFNQKYFILFLFYIGLTSLYVISFVIWSLIVFPQSSEVQVIHSIVLCIESCLFGIFVITVFVDQMQSIINDRSLIDTLKLNENSRTVQRILPSKRILFQNVFGSSPMILWLFPCDLKSSNKIINSQDTYCV